MARGIYVHRCSFWEGQIIFAREVPEKMSIRDGEYKSTQTNRFYPGRLSAERERALINFELSIDDLGMDDIVFSIARNVTHSIYIMLDVIRTKWGEDAAVFAAREYAYRRAKAGFTKWLKKHGVEAGTPALMASYQDYAHSLMGPAASTACTFFDENKVVVRRTKCSYHSFRPEGMRSMCDDMGDGFMKGYMEADKNFIKTEKIACLSVGNDYCERVFWYKK
jgi:hypothetical protein